MKLGIETVVRVDGASLNPRWKSPMYLVNGEFIASSIDKHNIHGESFDLYAGHTADVSLRAHDGNIWIARSPKPIKGTH